MYLLWKNCFNLSGFHSEPFLMFTDLTLALIFLRLALTKEKAFTASGKGGFCSNSENPRDLVLVTNHPLSGMLCDRRENVSVSVGVLRAERV